MEKKLVVAGKFGPVAREDNSQRFIGSEPFEVPLTGYYLRRIADGELVEYVAEAAPKKGK